MVYIYPYPFFPINIQKITGRNISSLFTEKNHHGISRSTALEHLRAHQLGWLQGSPQWTGRAGRLRCCGFWWSGWHSCGYLLIHIYVYKNIYVYRYSNSWHMYKYIYICNYICIYTYVSNICVYIYIYTIHMYTCLLFFIVVYLFHHLLCVATVRAAVRISWVGLSSSYLSEKPIGKLDDKPILGNLQWYFWCFEIS